MSDTSSNKGDYQNMETYGSLQKRIAALEAQLAENEQVLAGRIKHISNLEHELTMTQRQNALLRAVADEAHEYIKYEPISLIPDKYWRLRREAIDGGAMEDSE